jgi:hypothetical protein
LGAALTPGAALTVGVVPMTLGAALTVGVVVLTSGVVRTRVVVSILAVAQTPRELTTVAPWMARVARHPQVDWTFSYLCWKNRTLAR